MLTFVARARPARAQLQRATPPHGRALGAEQLSRDQCYHFLFRDLHTEHLDIYSFSSVGGVEQCVHALVAAFDASQAVQWRFARHLHYRGVRGSRVRIAAPRDFLDWLFDTFSLADVTAYDE